MSGCICWIIAIVLTGSLLFLVYFVATRGGAAALARDKQDHLRLLNEARIRSGKRPLTMEEFESGSEGGPEDVPVARVVTAPAGNAEALERVTTEDEGDAAVTIPAAAPVAPSAAVADPDELGKRLSVVLVNRTVLSWTESEIRKRLEAAWGVEIPISKYAAEWVRQDVSTDPTKPGSATVISCGGFLFRVESQRLARGYEVADGPDVSLNAQSASAEARAVTRLIFLSRLTDGVEKEMVYGLLGKLAAELADTATVAVHLPIEGLLVVFDPVFTVRSLRGNDVVRALKGE